MERDTLKPDDPEDRYLTREADLLWNLTLRIHHYLDELQKAPRASQVYLEKVNFPPGHYMVNFQTTRALHLICLGAYRYMKDQGKEDWAMEILYEANTRPIV